MHSNPGSIDWESDVLTIMPPRPTRTGANLRCSLNIEMIFQIQFFLVAPHKERKSLFEKENGRSCVCQYCDTFVNHNTSGWCVRPAYLHHKECFQPEELMTVSLLSSFENKWSDVSVLSVDHVAVRDWVRRYISSSTTIEVSSKIFDNSACVRKLFIHKFTSKKSNIAEYQ